MSPCRERAGEKPHLLLFLQASVLLSQLVLLQPAAASRLWATDVPAGLPIAQGDFLMTIIRVCTKRGECPPSHPVP